MRVRNVASRSDEEVELQMTPMIDCVFLLLIFFLLTFKIVAPEGDFNIKMPRAAPSQGPPPDDQLPPITVRLTARSDGGLSQIMFGAASLDNFAQLRQRIRDMVGDSPSPSVLDSTEVELDCDYNLRYEFVVEAITAISGHVVSKDGKKVVVKLVEKIKFAPPKASR